MEYEAGLYHHSSTVGFIEAKVWTTVFQQ
jgi:hypothetical protein